MKGGIVVSAWEQLKMDVVAKVEAQEIDRETAQMTLQISDRTLRRYIAAFRSEGVVFALHKGRQRTPKNKIPEHLKIAAQELIKRQYFDFNMLHALDKINEDLDANIKREVFRKWCHEIGVVKRARRRRRRVRKYRPRMKQRGLLLLMDGSFHKWFGGIESCLIAVIDDATGEILQAEFAYGETTDACLKVLRELISKHGVFKLLYTDKAGVFGGTKRTGFSHVESALGDLGTNVLYAQSPEAKGRVERLFDTLQDRLIPEMRLAGVKNIRQANQFLREVYIPQMHNPKFAVKPQSPIDAFTPLPQQKDLNAIFCKREYRKVARDHTISFENRRYMLDKRFDYSIAGQRIEIRIYENGKWEAHYGGGKMKLIPIQKVEKLCAKSAA